MMMNKLHEINSILINNFFHKRNVSEKAKLCIINTDIKIFE